MRQGSADVNAHRNVFVGDEAAIDPSVRRRFGRAGLLSALGATAAVAGAIAVPDAAGVLLAVALVAGATAITHLGAPFARPGKPSTLRILIAGTAGAAGAALTAIVGPIVAVGVIATTYAVAVLSAARWPVSESSDEHEEHAGKPVPTGAVVTIVATLETWVALLAVSAAVTDSPAMALPLIVLITFGIVRTWKWIGKAYAARPLAGGSR